MPAVKHIEGLQTELDKSKFEADEFTVDKGNITVSLINNKAYNALDMGDHITTHLNVLLKDVVDNKSYQATAEFIAVAGEPVYSCSFSSDFKVIGNFDWESASFVNYVLFVPTQNKVLVIVDDDPIEIASVAEINAGSNNTKYITPLGARLSNISYKTATEILTNKNITSRTLTTASAAILDSDPLDYDSINITALDKNITLLLTPDTDTETLTDFQKIIYRIKDDGTSRNLTWTGTDFVSKGVVLPTATTASKMTTIGFIYDAVDELWGSVALSQEA